MRILVAEDERITRASLVRQLSNWGHSVAAAEDGEQAWELYFKEPFDIVLTDWEMPRLSGLDLIGRIRGTADAAFVYIIMLTGRTEKADLVRGIEAGADDFVSKPFDREELRVRLLAGERIVRLERKLNQQNQELREAGERMRNDLRAAARVQTAMLPAANIVTPHVRTAWRYVPTDELAGDGIGLHLIDDRYLIAYVLDVSGHGVPAALLSVSVMHAMAPIPPDTSLMRDPAGGPMGTVRAPELVADELNRRFPSEKNDGHFVTLGLVVLDTHTGRVRSVRAGHPLPILLRAGAEIPVPEDDGGLPLCITEGIPYEGGTIDLSPGDRLCLISDGLIEQFGGPDGKPSQFGTERIARALLAAQGTIEQAAERALDDLTAWTGKRKFADDVSVTIIEWLGAKR